MTDARSLYAEGMEIVDQYYRDVAKEIAEFVLEDMGTGYSDTAIRDHLKYEDDYCHIHVDYHETVIGYVYQWIDLADINITFRGEV